MTITATRLDEYGVPQHLFYDGPSPVSLNTFHEWVVFLKDHNFTIEDLCKVDFHTENEFYTMKEVASILRKSSQSIWRWTKAGEIKVARSGRSVLIPRSELERLQRAENRGAV